MVYSAASPCDQITLWFPYVSFASGRTGNICPSSICRGCSSCFWSLNNFSACILRKRVIRSHAWSIASLFFDFEIWISELRSAIINYSIISVITPAPTVLPPSRMANRRPLSMAIGPMSSTLQVMLSPGITISTPSANVTTPVTSVVRK